MEGTSRVVRRAVIQDTNVYTSGAVKSDHKESRSVYNAELSSGRQVCWKNDLTASPST